jgi:hypothetical protein
MVVATHALWYTGMYTNEVLIFWVQTAAVPPFFLVDGYLFLDVLRKQTGFSYRTYVTKSVRRLLLPWIIFTCFYGVIRAIFEYKGVLNTTVILGHGALDIIDAAYRSVISAQLYFLLSLFLIRLLSFFTKNLAELNPLWVASVWLGYTIVWNSIATAPAEERGLDPIFHAFWGLQFYLMGMVLYVYRWVVGQYAWTYACSAIVVLLVVRSAADAYPMVSQYAYILSVYFCSMAIYPHSGLVPMLGRHTMGIFLFHAPIVIKGASVLVPIVIQTPGFGQYAITVMVTVMVSLLATKVCSSFPYGSFLLGEMPKRRNT